MSNGPTRSRGQQYPIDGIKDGVAWGFGFTSASGTQREVLVLLYADPTVQQTLLPAQSPWVIGR